MEDFYTKPNSQSIEEIFLALTYVPKLFKSKSDSTTPQPQTRTESRYRSSSTSAFRPEESPFSLDTARDVIILYNYLESARKNKAYSNLNGLRNHPDVQAEIGKMKKQIGKIRRFLLFLRMVVKLILNQLFFFSHPESTN